MLLCFRRYRTYIGLLGVLMLFWGFGYIKTRLKSTTPNHQKCLYIAGYPNCYYFQSAVKLSEPLRTTYIVNVDRIERGEKWTEFRNSIMKKYPQVENHFTSPIVFLDDCSGGNSRFIGGFDRFSEIINDLK